MPSRLAVSDAWVALPNFNDVAIGIANIAARLAIFGFGLREELSSSTSPQFVAGLNIGNANIHEAADQIGIGWDTQRYRRFIRCGTAPGIYNEPRVRDLDVTRRAIAIAPAQNESSENRFVKSKRSLHVGDSEKVRDGNPILRRHLIGLLLDLYLAHGRLLVRRGPVEIAKARSWRTRHYIEKTKPYPTLSSSLPEGDNTLIETGVCTG